ncbi:MAG TPA: DUF4159 domain-containing protein [Anaerolineaceae bacterium]|nr:DUF4159 domain-containing protein [Anaerolineaceae bacterium]
MSNDNLLTLFPNKRIKPYDGMSVTAEVWNLAHDYHRQYNQAHNLFFHGSGILIGMEVVASDPPDSMVFILPGVVVDPNGKVIVLSEPVAYDLGDEIEGPLYLTINHRESSTSLKKNNDGSGLAFVNDEFLITARQTVPEKSMVELARFAREDRKSTIKDAQDPKGPKTNEIDLRFRRQIVMKSEQLLTSAVVYLGTGHKKEQGKGLHRLSDYVRREKHINLIVDDNADLDPGILGNSFLYLVGKGKFQLTKAQMKGLQGYLKHGGFLLMESCDGEAGDSFKNLAKEIGLNLNEKLSQKHLILSEPNFFVAPPIGFEVKGEILTGNGGVLSTFNYGALWNGDGKDRVPTREELRSAFEWGTNLLVYVLEDKEKDKGS